MVPCICVDKSILPQLGATPTPLLINALPAAALGNLDKAEVVEAYNISPTM